MTHLRRGMVGDDATVVAAIRAGDRGVFDGLVSRHRREIHVHCYRIVGSYDEAEEHTQETFLRAWRGRRSFEGRASARSWLYRIATNVCLDAVRRRPERRLRRGGDGWVRGTPPPRDLPWMQPYPDPLIDPVAPDDPAATVVARDELSIAFLTVLQVLPPTQRSVLVLRDVLDWSAKEVADLLDTSVAAVNSSLQRARTTISTARHANRPTVSGESERQLVAAYLDAHHRADPDAIVRLVTADVRLTMPPDDICLVGANQVAGFFVDVFDPRHGFEFRLVATRANGQPTAANYLRRPGELRFEAFSLDLLELDDHGRIVEITTFFVPHHFPLYGLPPHLDA